MRTTRDARLRAALGMMKLLVQGEADIRAGRVISQDRLFSKIRGALTKTRRRFSA